MATTQEIMDAASALGKLVSSHEGVVKFKQTLKKLQDDVDAQRLLNDYMRQVSKIGEKEAQGQPIEVEDKKQLTALQGQVTNNDLLREFQITQMDYLDLMRRIDEAITTQAMPQMAAPDLSGSPAAAPLSADPAGV